MCIETFFTDTNNLLNRWKKNDPKLIDDDPYLRLQKPGDGLLTKEFYDTMPEPFWGDPDNCSIVMINLNPAYKEGHDKLFSREKTQILCPNRYSDFAKTFPILNEDSYNPEGKEWWEGRIKYLDQLVDAYPNRKYQQECRKPFVIELCPWQTGKWGETGISIGKNKDIINHIKNTVFEPALYAIEHSQVDFAVAIGKPILDALKGCGFKVMQSWGPNPGNYDDDDFANNILPDNYPTTLKKGDTEETPANVFFKLLAKEEEGRLLKVLCIKKDGSNRVPGPKYKTKGIEQMILDYMAKVS